VSRGSIGCVSWKHWLCLVEALVVSRGSMESFCKGNDPKESAGWEMTWSG